MIKRARLIIKLRLWWFECKIKRKYLPQIEQAKRDRNYPKEQELDYQYYWEMQEIEEGRRSLIQEKLIQKAKRLMLPVPSRDFERLKENHEDQNWRYGQFGDTLLKDDALTQLRREIRREKKEKRDSWIPIISVLTGLIGAAAALSSIWLTWFSH